jgi:uncharacterized membrane protein YfcA
VLLAAAAGGAVNSIAGGGTLLTFPALLGLGIPALVANATSTVALLPASGAAIWGYREALAGARQWITRFAIPSFLGGLLGALLLLVTPADRFDALVPWLVLGATTLFLLQRPIARALRRAPAPTDPGTAPSVRADDAAPPPSIVGLGFQLLVGVYGGYFGAGIGILMLAALGFFGFTNIHRMNGLKNWGAFCINGVAAVAFAVSGIVDWRVAAAMAVGSTLGGYAGSRLAQRVPQPRVRQAVVAIGFASGIWLLVERI